VSAIDRNRFPEPGAIRPFEFPPVARRRISNGLDLRVARMTRLPVVSLNLYVDAGESALDTARAGLAVLTGDALEGGTAHHSGVELAEALEGIGATLGVGTGWEGTSVSLTCLADRIDEALRLLAEAALEPSFPAEEVERARDQQLAEIRRRRMDPGTLAGDEAARRYYREESPYARPLGGTERSVAPVGRESVRGFAEAFYRPVHGGLVVTGDVDIGEVESLAEECFAGWEGAPPPLREISVEPRTRERRLWVVDRPDAVQSEVRIGHVGAARSSEHFFALTVLNTVLGGAFTSRLNLNLRERNGFTYGVRSRFSFRRRPGPFQVSTAVGSDVTADAVREAIHEIEALIAEGPTEEEVAAARDFVAGVFPLRLETTGQVASRLAELIVYGLPDDYYHRYRDRVRAVSVDDAAEAGRTYIRPGELQVVVVGDARTVAPALERLDLGPVEVVEGSGT